MKLDFCVCCGSEDNLYQHHLIPNSIEKNDMTVTLCGKCHGIVHGRTKEITTRELTRKALQGKKERGEVYTNVAYGYSLSEDGKRLIIDPNEQRVIQRIHKYRKEGHSYNQIAGQLNSAGYKTKWGKAWSHKQVARILRADNQD